MSQVWKVSIPLPNEESAEPFERAVHGIALGTAAFEIPGNRPGEVHWTFEFYTQDMPPYDLLAPRIALASLEAGIPEPDFHAAPIPEMDWVAENQKSFTPIRAGRFFVHQEFDRTSSPPGTIRLIVNAGTAFGTGTHATTRACLLALDRLMKRRRYTDVLDLGCGTAILAMGIAKAQGGCITASDIDAEAVRVSAENLRLNRLSGSMTLAVAPGFTSPALKRNAPFDLIVANILARPLMKLARPMENHLTDDGTVVLSGLLNEQEQSVLFAYRAQGLVLVDRIRIDGWSALILERRGR